MGHRLGGRTRAFISLIAGICMAQASMLSYAQDSDDLYLLDIHADGYRLAESVPAYETENAYLIEFSEFLAAVEFPIVFKDGNWSGWFRSQETQFFWNTETETVHITGHDPAKIDVLQWIENDDGFYVSAQILENWFDIRLDVDPRLQVATVSSEDPLPFQAWHERTLAKYRYRPGNNLDADVIVPDNYQWATLPQFNLSTHFLTRKNDGMTSHATTGSMVVGLDLLKHSVMYTGTAARTDDEDGKDVDNTHRLTIERAATTPDGAIYAGANRYMIGDIYQGTANLIVDANTGRGFNFGRFAAGNAGNLSVVTIVGDAPPGWEIELYRNGTLIDFSTAGLDGRYKFPDQDIPFGENIFVAKLYGPQGQTAEDRQVFWGGGAELAKGDYDYSVSHIDFDQYFIDGVPDNADGLPASYATDFRASRAWTKNLQVGTAFTRAGLGNRERDGTYNDSEYFSVFGNVKAGPGVFIGEAVTQFDAGEAWSLEYLTGFSGHNISFVHRFFNDYDSPATIHRDKLGTINEISFNGPMGPDRMSSYVVRFRQRDKTDGTSDFRVFNRLGTRLGPVSLTNEFEHISSEGPDTAHGNLRAAGRLKRLSLRGQLDYHLADQRRFTQVSASMNWDLLARLNNNLVLTKNLTNDKQFFFTNLTSVRVQNFNLSFSVSSDLDAAYQFGAGFNVSFGYDGRRQGFVTDRRSLAGTGRAAMNLFLDENNNGVREPGEQPVSWASYKDEEMLSMAPGTVPLQALPRYQPVKIETRHFKFDDPFLVPRSRIYELYTHAGGDLSVDIAIVMTGDVEGYVYAGSDDQTLPVKGVIVTLFDSDGEEISAARSEFDGFYSFNGIPAGKYEVRVRPKAGEDFLSQPFTLDGQEGFVSLEKIVLYE